MAPVRALGLSPSELQRDRKAKTYDPYFTSLACPWLTPKFKAPLLLKAINQKNILKIITIFIQRVTPCGWLSFLWE